MHELKLSGGCIRMYQSSIKLIHSITRKKRHVLEDITLLFKDIQHVELYKPLWPFSSGYIRFSLDGSHHLKKNIRTAEKESFSMLCHSMQEYQKLKRIKRFIETRLEVLHSD
ncbi:hypothetical protein GCM10011571_31760 [Marinithermofilum abyssi]|uniref:Uncharacterized protein n=1 Tax=Marinithermofilum abyssi TaxID=1571185 RepID=A0A8J2YEX6_9BACL|nr:hypothetical protein [Marinithermofilum abyssi]GGE27193.1 hypothetical protein GCM10011571_31760 [Marinithermofilum abyssi]